MTMKATNGTAQAYRAATNGTHSAPRHDEWWRKQLARDRAIQFLGKTVQLLLIVSISGFAIYGFWLTAHSPKSGPDPYDAIEAQIDAIDLNQPKTNIRYNLNKIKKAVEGLRPDDRTDPTDQYGGA